MRGLIINVVEGGPIRLRRLPFWMEEKFKAKSLYGGDPDNGDHVAWLIFDKRCRASSQVFHDYFMYL